MKSNVTTSKRVLFVRSLLSMSELPLETLEQALDTLGEQSPWSPEEKQDLLVLLSARYAHSTDNWNGKPLYELFCRSPHYSWSQKVPASFTNGFFALSDLTKTIPPFRRSFRDSVCDHVHAAAARDGSMWNALVPWLSVFPWSALEAWIPTDGNKAPLSERILQAFDHRSDTMDSRLLQEIHAHSDLTAPTSSGYPLVFHVSEPMLWDRFLQQGGNPKQMLKKITLDWSGDKSDVELWRAIVLRHNSEALVEHVKSWASKNDPSYEKWTSQQYFKRVNQALTRYATVETMVSTIKSEKNWYDLVDISGRTPLMVLMSSHNAPGPRYFPAKKMDQMLGKVDFDGRSAAFYLLCNASPSKLSEWCSVILQHKECMKPHDGKGLFVRLAEVRNVSMIRPVVKSHLKHTDVQSWFAGSNDELNEAVHNMFRAGLSQDNAAAWSAIAQHFHKQITHPRLLGFLATCSALDGEGALSEKLMEQGAALPSLPIHESLFSGPHGELVRGVVQCCQARESHQLIADAVEGSTTRSASRLKM